MLQKKSSMALLLYPLLGVLVGGVLGLACKAFLFTDEGGSTSPVLGGIFGCVAGYIIGVQLGQERALILKSQKTILEALTQQKE